MGTRRRIKGCGRRSWESARPHVSPQDCEDPNPLIRALAVRTMGCIRVDKITEYLCEPLRKCLKDEDPYVRKTAAVCVAKLHDINAQLVEDQGFLDTLKDLISDSNPMVIRVCLRPPAFLHLHALAPVLPFGSRPLFGARQPLVLQQPTLGLRSGLWNRVLAMGLFN